MTPYPKRKRISLSRNSKAWEELVAEVFKRDGYRCFWCGKIFKPNYLAPCHIKSVGAGGDDIAENLRTGCKSCHGKEHNGEFLNGGPPFKKSHNRGQLEPKAPLLQA